MARSDLTSVDDYMASQPEAVRRVLARVRTTIRRAVPAAEEVISYKMPTYTLHGRPVLYFAGWSRHYSLYPVDRSHVAAFKDDGAVYEIRKSTIRFPLSEPVPVKLIGAIARQRAKAVAARAKAKTAAPAKRRVRR